MDKREGYEYAIDSRMLSDEDNFFKSYFSLYRSKELNLGEKAILSLILSYVNRRMVFYMSNSGISDTLGISRSTTINLINTLKEKELVSTHIEYDSETGYPKRFIKINRRNYNNLIKK